MVCFSTFVTRILLDASKLMLPPGAANWELELTATHSQREKPDSRTKKKATCRRHFLRKPNWSEKNVGFDLTQCSKWIARN